MGEYGIHAHAHLDFEVSQRVAEMDTSDIDMADGKSSVSMIEPNRIFTAIRGGDLGTLRRLVDTSSPEEVQGLLTVRESGSVLLRRPSNGREVYVRHPTPLVLAVTEWFTEIVEYLAGLKVCLDEGVTLDDVTNTETVYGGVTALHLAAMAGKLNMVQTLLKNGAKVNKQTTLGDTPLFEACFEGHQAVVEELMQNGGELTLQNNRDVSCLMIASYADNADVIRFIVESGVDLSKVDKDGRNVLFYVVAEGRLDTLCYLLDNGVKVRSDNHQVNILMEAVYHVQMDIVRYICRHHRILGIGLDDVDDSGRNVLFHVECEDQLEYLLTEGVTIAPANDGRTLLMTATLKDNQVIVCYLAENAAKLGFDLNEVDTKGRNVLFYCITGGDIDMFDMLVSSGVRIEASEDGVTVLMQAVAKHRVDFTEHLLSDAGLYELDINSRDRDGWNALMYAVASGHIDIFETLIDHGATTHAAADGRTVLMQAAAKGDMEFLRYLLDNAQDFRVYINQRDLDGWNCLFYTIQGGHMESFKFLLKRGARVCSALNGSTLLMEAVDKNKAEFVKQIVNTSKTLGIDINQKDKDGNNALFYAAAAGNVELFRRLLEAACVVECDLHNRTLLMQAALHGHLEMVQYVVNNSQALGVDVCQLDKDGRNAIYYCVEGGHVQVLEYLVQYGVPLVTDAAGKTNLMQAARAGRKDITNFLLKLRDQSGLDINAKDKNGENALFYAARSKCVLVVDSLLSNHITITDNLAGVNVLSQSMADGNEAIVGAILGSPDVNMASVVNGKDVKGRTTLHHLVQRGELQRLVSLGKYYSPQFDSDLGGTTLLMTACKHNENTDIIRYLCETMKVDLYRTDNRRRTALYYAVESSSLPAVDFLIQHSSNQDRNSNNHDVPNGIGDSDSGMCDTMSSVSSEAISSIAGETPLINLGEDTSCMSCSPVKVLPTGVATTPSYNTANSILDSDVDGLSPLMVAVVTGSRYIVEILLRSRSGRELVKCQDRRGRTACHYCAIHGYLSIMEMIVTTGGAVDVQDAEGLTAAMLAASHGRSRALAYLLRVGCDLELVDTSQRNALHHCFSGTPTLRCVRLLLRCGVKVNQRDLGGRTPLMAACGLCSRTQIAVIRSLVEAGADPVLQDTEGRDAFDHCPFDNEYVKGLLREHVEMDPYQREALTLNTDRLKDKLEMNSVLRGLLREGIFTKTLNFEVMKRPPAERVDRLIELLCFRGQRAFRSLCKVLKDLHQVELAYELLKEAYRKEEEIFW